MSEYSKLFRMFTASAVVIMLLLSVTACCLRLVRRNKINRFYIHENRFENVCVLENAENSVTDL